MEQNSSMTTAKLVKIIVFAALLVAASSYVGLRALKVGQLGDAIFITSLDAAYPLIYLLLALLAVAVAAGLLTALVRPLWIAFIAFALASLALLFIWEMHLLGIVLAAIYLLAGLLYTQGVARGLSEHITFTVHPIKDNLIVILSVLVIATCILFYAGYAAQIEEEGFALPAPLTDMAMRIAEQQIEAIPDIPLEEKEQAMAEFREQFEQQMADLIAPYQRFIAIGVALILLGLLLALMRPLSWVAALILKAIFPILAACRVTTVVKEMQEVERVTID